MRISQVPWKNEVIQYIPFIGMMAGKVPVPSRSIMESIILAALPIVLALIFVVPKLEERTDNIEDKIESAAESRSHEMAAYNSALNDLSTDVKGAVTAIGTLKTDIAVITTSNEFIKEIANTKVKTIEGRMGVLEHELMRLKK